MQERGWRTGLKPLNVVQPEGPSFSVDGNMVFWQKWSMRVSFNYREGLVLHTVGSVSASSTLQQNTYSTFARQIDCSMSTSIPLRPSNISDSFSFHWLTLCDASGSTCALHLHQQPNLEKTADLAQFNAPEN